MAIASCTGLLISSERGTAASLESLLSDEAWNYPEGFGSYQSSEGLQTYGWRGKCDFLPRLRRAPRITTSWHAVPGQTAPLASLDNNARSIYDTT